MPIDPCREWLGIDAVDLSSPHLVLAVRADETDSQLIERAAEERLRILRAISPGPFERAHAALISRIGEARDEMLEAARRTAARQAAEPPRAALAPPPPPLSSNGPPAWPGVVSAPPPLPTPPVPIPPAAFLQAEVGRDDLAASCAEVGRSSISPDATGADAPIVVGGGRRRRRRTGDSGWIVATIASLIAAAAALVALVVISGEERGRRLVARGPERPRTAREEPAAPPRRVAPARRPAAAPKAPKVSREESMEDEPAEPSPQPDPPSPAPPEEPKPEEPKPEEPKPEEPKPEEPKPEEPKPDPAAGSAAVENALRKTYTEIRAGRFPAASKAVDEALAAADDDLTAERVERWRLLVTSAKNLAEYRDQAFAELAAEGSDVNVGGNVISVIEMKGTQFVYKDRGTVKRPRKDEIPPPIVLAVLRQWFAADGRPANDIYLGVQHLIGDAPDLGAARTCWRRAAQGGEDTAPLMALLTDPVLAGDRQE